MRGSGTSLGAGPAALLLRTALQLRPDVEVSPGPRPIPSPQRVREVSARWCFSLDPIKLPRAFSAFLLPSWLPQLLSQILAMCWSRSPPHLMRSYVGAGDITTPAWDL